ncbi:MAG: inverse autotransporter beta domain-containing protein [Verrucomicrobia bacterium]|nr:inverse autotransporter beta domain-containing protein [Verrucomicrobiota bacterium]
MNAKLLTILTSLSISPALLFADGDAAKYDCIAMPKNKPCVPPKRAYAAAEETCSLQSPRTERIEIRHIEANGVGYNQGYSTIEGFFTVPSTLDGSWVPFLDLRGHIFNDGEPAFNAGAGLRYLCSSRVYGANVYYDYRKTHRFHSNQVGFGLETLGEIWDFRLNGYIPVGKKDSHLFHTRFHEFKHNSIILSSRKEIAMKGGNAEVGAHALRKENYKLYAAAGPYYFERQGRVAWGGEGRVALTLFDYLRLQVSGSYDKIFRGIFQGEAAFTFSFGGKRTIKYRKESNFDNSYCSQRRMVLERALQRVDRNEIIVVTKKHQKTKAINPDTGQAYKVWFVDNTSHSQGTFESPFNTLADAQNSSGPHDIIYVFPGDGTDTGMNTGITLQKGQQLLGAGVGQQVETTRGLINIRAHAKGLPTLSNILSTAPVGRSAVVLNAGDNVVSGFYLVDTLKTGSSGTDFTAGLRIEQGLNYLIKNNMMSTGSSMVEGGNACNVHGGGNVTFINNTFINVDHTNQGYGVDIFAYLTPLEGYFVFQNNLFTGANNTSGLLQGIHFEPRRLAAGGSAGIIGNLKINIVGNTFNSQSNTSASSPAAIALNCTPDSSNFVSAHLTGNYITMPAGITTPIAGMNIQGHGPGPLIATLHENVVLTVSPVPGYKFNNFGSLSHLQLHVGSDNFGTSTGP